MTRFAFACVPTKMARAAQANRDAAERVPHELRTSVAASRTACLQAQAALLEVLRKNTTQRGTAEASLHASLRDADARARLCDELCSTASAYAAALLDGVAAAPSLAVAYAYCWSGALEGVEHTVCSDYRYDLVCVYYNVTALLMNVAQACSVVPSTAMSGSSGHEKDMYRLLQSAAGYGALCAQLLVAMQAQCVGFIDSTAALHSLHAVVDALACVAVAQAQEVAAERAATAHPKDDVDTVACLSYQAALLWQRVAQERAVAAASGTAATATPLLCMTYEGGRGSVADLAAAKGDVYMTLAYMHAAAHRFSTTDVDTGLCYLRVTCDRATALASRTMALRKAARKAAGGDAHKAAAAAACLDVRDVLLWLDACGMVVQKGIARLQTLHKLAYGNKRASTSAAVPALPPPQALAAATAATLPRPLPTLPPLPPPPTLTASEAAKAAK